MSYSASEYALSKAAIFTIGDGGAVFREAREARGYSIEDLAVTCGLTMDEIRDLEQGLDTSSGYLRRVAAALGLPESVAGNA